MLADKMKGCFDLYPADPVHPWFIINAVKLFFAPWPFGAPAP
jgi:hypothetical protein